MAGALGPVFLSGMVSFENDLAEDVKKLLAQAEGLLTASTAIAVARLAKHSKGDKDGNLLNLKDIPDCPYPFS